MMRSPAGGAFWYHFQRHHVRKLPKQAIVAHDLGHSLQSPDISCKSYIYFFDGEEHVFGAVPNVTGGN